ncbi:hypothetical protein KKA14_22325 [bacterium]|nr:hypothetical protein [bacterium]
MKIYPPIDLTKATQPSDTKIEKKNPKIKPILFTPSKLNMILSTRKKPIKLPNGRARKIMKNTPALSPPRFIESVMLARN